MLRLLVFGCNTDVGKTVVSAGLMRALSKVTDGRALYIKPLQTGAALGHCDSRTVLEACKGQVATKTLFAWDEPVSPHIAAAGNYPPSDEETCNAINSALDPESCCLIETAGGVLSPGASGTPQADMYQQMKYPTVLVGDSKLGGISTTLTALECLGRRGYDVQRIIFINHTTSLGNAEYVTRKGIPVDVLPSLPPLPISLDQWHTANEKHFENIIAGFHSK